LRAQQAPIIRTSMPARLDALPWSRRHWRIVIALGIPWVLNGLEVTVTSQGTDSLFVYYIVGRAKQYLARWMRYSS